MTQGKQDYEGAPTRDYCDTEVMERYRWRRENPVDTKKALPIFNVNPDKCNLVAILPGGLDGERDAIFWRGEIFEMVRQGIIPEGIHVIFMGQRCAVKMPNMLKVVKQ